MGDAKGHPAVHQSGLSAERDPDTDRDADNEKHNKAADFPPLYILSRQIFLIRIELYKSVLVWEALCLRYRFS